MINTHAYVFIYVKEKRFKDNLICTSSSHTPWISTFLVIQPPLRVGFHFWSFFCLAFRFYGTYWKALLFLLASMRHWLRSLWQMSYSRFFNTYIFLFSYRWALIVFWQLKRMGGYWTSSFSAAQLYFLSYISAKLPSSFPEGVLLPDGTLQETTS